MTEQLWAPAFSRSGALRAVVDPAPDQEWRTVESYWLVPNAESARLLVPRRPRTTASRALTNYRRLRTPGTNVARFALGAAARLGVPLSASTVEVQVRHDAPPGTADLLPLARLSEALGRQVFASTGVRTSDNRKTMLQLVDAVGEPVGYAKVGWDEVTDRLVATEGDVLAAIGGGDGPVRAPRLIARLDYLGHPVTVTEPLPADARGSLTRVAEPTSEELFALTPVVRHARIAETGQLRAVRARLDEALDAPHVRELAGQALAVSAEVAAHDVPLPVTDRWHGDLAPWNRARDAEGRLWIWDWENAEPDAVAGLDALHWAFSTQRLAARDVDRMSLPDALAAANHHLAAIGLGEADRAVVAAAYAVTTVERACTIARHSGTWETAFISPDGLAHLLRQAASRQESS
ncbi:hypothetical protein [Nocardioides mangrovi]|uniref:Aminoglycoside phosphotransferase domain-containing protein n=1 Tax=Nocardioides mangrovi TaxID=2874580 RepID=A0ABS7UFH2_9ACTN|nr:hypothetical protein [Nocardioides mangrovi]MBZ5739741.1 hypothetical protein [Nocardioides mangrovi]